MAGGPVTMPGSVLALPPAKSDPVIVAVEKSGKDEEQSKEAAFRESVAQAVGLLIDVKEVVRNDRLVADQVVEFTGEYVRSFDTLAIQPINSGGVKVRIRATAERLRLFNRAVGAKRGVRELNGSGLVTTTQTREGSRRAATALLAQLGTDVRKLARAEVTGSPGPSVDGAVWS